MNSTVIIGAINFIGTVIAIVGAITAIGSRLERYFTRHFKENPRRVARVRFLFGFSQNIITIAVVLVIGVTLARPVLSQFVPLIVTQTPRPLGGILTEFPQNHRRFLIPGTIRGLTLDPNGYMWLISSDANLVGCISLSGDGRNFNIPTSHSVPSAITLGPDGNLWFTEANANKIGRINSRSR